MVRLRPGLPWPHALAPSGGKGADSAFASFLTGQPVVFLQGIGDFSRGIRGNNAYGYVQDTYRVTPHFTVNAGLRYELPEPYTEIHNRMSLFEPGKQSRVLPDAPAGLLYPGDPGVPAGLIPTDMKAFAPRIGVAWDPSRNGKLLVTAAYGIFYEPYYTGQGGPLQAPISAPPFLGTPQVSLPDFANPFNGNPPAPGDVLHPTHEPDSVADVATPLFSGLGLEPATIVRVPLAV